MDELRVSGFVIDFNKGGSHVRRPVDEQSISVSGSKSLSTRQFVGITVEPLVIGDLSELGMCRMKNCDLTNFVKVRAGESGADLVMLKAGEEQFFRLATNTPYVIADTAPVEIDFDLFED